MKPNKNDVEKAREIIKKFDPSLVIAAVQQLSIKPEDLNKAKEAIKGVFDSIDKDPQYKMEVLKQASADAEMEVMNGEIDNIKNEIIKVDLDAVIEALKDILYGNPPDTNCGKAIYSSTLETSLIKQWEREKLKSYICINFCIRFKLPYCNDCLPMTKIYYSWDLDQLKIKAWTQMEAAQALEFSRGASAVIGVGGRTGFAGLCVDIVKCPGESIQVMTTCLAALFSLDLGKEGLINPADAVLKLSESHPALHKRVSKMIEDMKANGEL